MTFLHTVVARNEGHNIWLTLGKETRELLGFLFMDNNQVHPFQKHNFDRQEQLPSLLFLL